MAQPEWHWGIPNVIIEALAARNAVVTTRFGSVEELVQDGETALPGAPRDPRALCATPSNASVGTRRCGSGWRRRGTPRWPASSTSKTTQIYLDLLAGRARSAES